MPAFDAKSVDQFHSRAADLDIKVRPEDFPLSRVPASVPRSFAGHV